MDVYLFDNPTRDLTGLRYFKNLKSLTVDFSRVNNVPTFPPNLVYLEWVQNEVTLLPSLPNTLEELVCFGSSFTRLPKLPNGIKKINCSLNQIDSLPDFPNSLQEIDCSINSLVMLPTLLVGLKKLNCSGNFLTTLPSLPSSLISLNCATNNLSYLPILSDSLATLICANNTITYLPLLPKGLQRLDCYNNQLVTLPILSDSLISLNCFDNHIHCLPKLPSKLSYVRFDYLSKISCIPNIPNIDCKYYNSQFGGNQIYPVLCDSFYDIYNCRNLLPLTLTSFTTKLQQNNVLLNWHTVNEVNVSHFNIQRSSNGKDFTNIGRVNAGSNYNFIDELKTKDQLLKTIYYKLEIVDKDGSKT